MTAEQPPPLAATEALVVTETGRGRFQAEAQTGAGAFLIDEPRSLGGLGSGPNPYELLGAALGACTAMTIRLYAEHKGWPLAKVQVSVLHRRATLQARDLFERTISLDGGLDDDQKARLMDIAQRCPVHLTLERGAEVRTTMSQAPPPALTPAAGEHMRDMEEACRA